MPDLESLDREELIRLIRELHRQVEDLRKQNEELQRKDKRSAAPFSKGERKKNPKRPGRKPGQGEFSRRPAPPSVANSAPPVEVPVEETRCPFCGGTLAREEPEEASVTDIPAAPEPEVRLFQVHVCRCQNCGRKTRGKHPDVAPDQYGATAHRVGPRIKATAHSLHKGTECQCAGCQGFYRKGRGSRSPKAPSPRTPSNKARDQSALHIRSCASRCACAGGLHRRYPLADRR